MTLRTMVDAVTFRAVVESNIRDLGYAVENHAPLSGGAKFECLCGTTVLGVLGKDVALCWANLAAYAFEAQVPYIPLQGVALRLAAETGAVLRYGGEGWVALPEKGKGVVHGSPNRERRAHASKHGIPPLRRDN